MVKRLPEQLDSKTNVINNINSFLDRWIVDKQTGKIVFEINFNQGGISQVILKRENRLK